MKRAIELKADYLHAYLDLVKSDLSEKNDSNLEEDLQNLAKVNFYSGQFVPDLKVIAEQLQKAGKADWAKKIGALYTENEFLLKTHE
jgi:hypothetical protein